MLAAGLVSFQGWGFAAFLAGMQGRGKEPWQTPVQIEMGRKGL